MSLYLAQECIGVMKMSKYEYHHVQQKVGLTGVLDKHTLSKLNRLGNEGWELASTFSLLIMDGKYHIFYVFKREVKS